MVYIKLFLLNTYHTYFVQTFSAYSFCFYLFLNCSSRCMSDKKINVCCKSGAHNSLILCFSNFTDANDTISLENTNPEDTYILTKVKRKQRHEFLSRTLRTMTTTLCHQLARFIIHSFQFYDQTLFHHFLESAKDDFLT